MKLYFAKLFLAAALLFAVTVHAQLIDPTFSYTSGFNGDVNSIVVQSNDKILAGGDFTSYNGTTRNRISRLNADGTVDVNFTPGTGFDAEVKTIAVQTDGKIVVGGNFTTCNGTSRNGIARLNADGSLDTDFTPGTGFDEEVDCIVIQADGKILVGGGFTSYNGTTRKYLARLKADGTLDTDFTTNFTFSFHGVQAIVLVTGNKILVGGDFTAYGSISTSYIARLNTDGSLDTGFDSGFGFNAIVNTLVVQSDGKILAGGSFSQYNEVSINRIVRLSADGALDTGFNTGTGFDMDIYTIVLQQDGKIIAGGNFNSYNDITRNGIIRLAAADGSLDTGFDPEDGFYGDVNTIALQTNGKILAGGTFTYYGMTERNHIVRLQTCTAPTVTQAAYPNAFCSNGSAFTLTGGSPAGGTYSGDGVSAGKFDPAAAGDGSHTITYTYTDANACVNTATTDIIVSGVCMDVVSASGGIDLSIYPNPGNGMFTIASLRGTGTLEVYNNVGALVYTAEITDANNTCNLSNLAKGMYTFNLRHEGSLSVQKVILQ